MRSAGRDTGSSKRRKLQTDSARVESPLSHDDASPTAPLHPLRVKPLGNLYESSAPNIKIRAGSFAKLPDELLLHFLDWCAAPELLSLGATCKALHAFSSVDELWKTLVIESSSDFKWRGSWRDTHLGRSCSYSSSVSCANLFSDCLYHPFHCANIDLLPFTRTIPKQNRIIRLTNLTQEVFNSEWTNRPFILTEPIKRWPLYRAWSVPHLLSQYAKTKFRAEAIDWSLESYVEYMRNNSDESPVYLFDKRFVEKMHISEFPPTHSETGEEIKGDYWAPEAFGQDFFSYLGSLRPDHRWMILGPARSGSRFHKDPNGTSAWNAVVTGAKYWLMFPSPSCGSGAGLTIATPPGVFVSSDESSVTSPLSIPEYFHSFHAAARASSGCVEGICRAGEVLHVPSGWFHLVLNIDESLAITQNFVPRGHLCRVLGFLRDQRAAVSGFDWEKVGGDPFGAFVTGLRRGAPDVLEEAMGELESVDADKKETRKMTAWEKVKQKDMDEEKSDRKGSFSFGFATDDSD